MAASGQFLLSADKDFESRVLRSAESRLCIPVNRVEREGRPVPVDQGNPVDEDLRLVTLAHAADYLSMSRGALYRLLGSGALVSVHIGRARRVPMVELRRFVRQALEATSGRAPDA